jgi:hypothetical protein
MKFAVYQIQLTSAQVDLINAKGHSAVPAQIAKLDMTMDFQGDKIGGLASDYNDCFEVGNIGPESSIERLTHRMSSLSVGDVLVGEDGTVVVIAPVGFVAFSFNPKKVAA